MFDLLRHARTGYFVVLDQLFHLVGMVDYFFPFETVLLRGLDFNHLDHGDVVATAANFPPLLETLQSRFTFS